MVYHQCVTALHDELSIDPGAEIQTLYPTLLEYKVVDADANLLFENFPSHSVPDEILSPNKSKTKQPELVRRFFVSLSGNSY